MATKEKPDADKIILEVVTPLEAVLNEQVDSVVLPGSEGEFGVLSGHLPLLSRLDIGGMRVIKNDKIEHYFIDGGFAEVFEDRVTVMTEGCDGVEDIDVVHARKLLAEAEKEYETYMGSTERVQEDILEKHQKELKRQRMKLLLGGEDDA